MASCAAGIRRTFQIRRCIFLRKSSPPTDAPRGADHRRAPPAPAPRLRFEWQDGLQADCAGAGKIDGVGFRGRCLATPARRRLGALAAACVLAGLIGGSGAQAHLAADGSAAAIEGRAVWIWDLRRSAGAHRA